MIAFDLFLEFHHFADIPTRALEANGQTAIGALTEAIGQWQKLVLSRPLLSDAQALGLRGELAVLAGLIRAPGPESVGAWTGTTAVSFIHLPAHQTLLETLFQLLLLKNHNDAQ